MDDTASSVLAGVLLSLIPGFHPLLLSLGSAMAVSIVYGMYTALSVIPSVYLGAFSAATAYTAIVAHRLVRRGLGRHAVVLYVFGTLFGILLAVLYLPLTAVLSIRLPRVLIFSFLVAVALVTVLSSRRPIMALFLSAFYALYGFIVLDPAFPVSNPLPVAVSGIFGASTVLLSVFERRRMPLGKIGRIDFISILRGAVFGFIAAMLTAYFPAVSLSLATFVVQPLLRVTDEEMMVANGASASSAAVLTAVGRKYGLVRSALAAALPQHFSLPDLLACYSISLLLGASIAVLVLPLLYRLYSRRIIKVSALATVAIFAHFLAGPPGIVLLVSATLAGTLTHLSGVEKRVAMFFLLGTTLIYYAPM